MAVVTLVTLDKVPLCSFDGVSNILLPRRPFSSSSGGPLPSCGSWIHLCLWFLLSSCIVPGFSSIVAECGGALLQIWCVDFCQVLVSCASLIVPWLLFSCMVCTWAPPICDEAIRSVKGREYRHKPRFEAGKFALYNM